MICECHRLNFRGQLVGAQLLLKITVMTNHHKAFDESDGLTISCTVLYPEQFDALRRTYDCEKNMVESLSRCVKWNATGGKSGSAFLKTRGKHLLIVWNLTNSYHGKTIALLPRNYPSLNYKQWRRLHLHTLITCRQQFMPMLVFVCWFCFL